LPFGGYGPFWCVAVPGVLACCRCLRRRHAMRPASRLVCVPVASRVTLGASRCRRPSLVWQESECEGD
jgi:hypothetical protein